MEDLNPAVVGIDDENAVIAVDEHPRRQLKGTELRASAAEVIQQIALVVEYLHHAPQAVDDIEIALGVDADSFGTEDVSRAVADFADGVTKRAIAAEHLDAEVHRVDHDQVLSVEPQFGGKIKFEIAGAALSDGLQDVALHVEHEHLVAQRVSHVDALRGGVDRDSGGAFEIAFPAFDAADH